MVCRRENLPPLEGRPVKAAHLTPAPLERGFSLR
jgi:hypothetical protein